MKPALTELLGPFLGGDRAELVHRRLDLGVPHLGGGEGRGIEWVGLEGLDVGGDGVGGDACLGELDDSEQLTTELGLARLCGEQLADRDELAEGGVVGDERVDVGGHARGEGRHVDRAAGAGDRVSALGDVLARRLGGSRGRRRRHRARSATGRCCAEWRPAGRRSRGRLRRSRRPCRRRVGPGCRRALSRSRSGTRRAASRPNRGRRHALRDRPRSRSLRTVSASSAPTASTNGNAAANSFVDSDRRRMAGISFRQLPLLGRNPGRRGIGCGHDAQLSGGSSSILSKCEHLLRLECEHGQVTTTSAESPPIERLSFAFVCASSSFPRAMADRCTDPIGVRRHGPPVAVQREDR